MSNSYSSSIPSMPSYNGGYLGNTTGESTVNQWPGIYAGVVTNNSDPQNLSRVKMQVPQVMGMSETDWAYPTIPPLKGQTGPKAGTQVYVTFSGGDPDYPIYHSGDSIHVKKIGQFDGGVNAGGTSDSPDLTIDNNGNLNTSGTITSTSSDSGGAIVAGSGGFSTTGPISSTDNTDGISTTGPISAGSGGISTTGTVTAAGFSKHGGGNLSFSSINLTNVNNSISISGTPIIDASSGYATAIGDWYIDGNLYGNNGTLMIQDQIRLSGNNQIVLSQQNIGQHTLPTSGGGSGALTPNYPIAANFSRLGTIYRVKATGTVVGGASNSEIYLSGYGLNSAMTNINFNSSTNAAFVVEFEMVIINNSTSGTIQVRCKIDWETNGAYNPPSTQSIIFLDTQSTVDTTAATNLQINAFYPSGSCTWKSYWSSLEILGTY